MVSCFRNPPNSDMDCSIFKVRTFLCASIHTGAVHTDNESAQHFDSEKNSHKFCLCSGRDSILWSWNPLDIEADAIQIEPPRIPNQPKQFMRTSLNLYRSRSNEYTFGRSQISPHHFVAVWEDFDHCALLTLCGCLVIPSHYHVSVRLTELVLI